MKNHAVSNKDLDRFMHFILNHGPSLSESDMEELMTFPDAWACLQTLESRQAISYQAAFQSDHIYSLKVLDNGILYFY